MIEQKQCLICEASFPQGLLDEQRCPTCIKQYPGVANKAQLKGRQQKGPQTMTEEVIREMIFDILSQAGIVRDKCESCRELFFKRSPAQKYCDKCKVKTVESKKE